MEGEPRKRRREGRGETGDLGRSLMCAPFSCLSDTSAGPTALASGCQNGHRDWGQAQTLVWLGRLWAAPRTPWLSGTELPGLEGYVPWPFIPQFTPSTAPDLLSFTTGGGHAGTLRGAAGWW